MTIIKTTNLSRNYRTNVRESGLKNAFKALIKRKYKNIEALNNINLEIKKGERVGIIGPNGAGKSTLIKILTGVLLKGDGEARVLGLDPFKDRKKLAQNIGVVFGQRSQLWWDLPVKETFELLKEIYKVEDKQYEETLEEINKLLELDKYWNQPVRKLSLGQRMRAEVAASLIHRPKILFLDEPTIGIDVVGKSQLRSFIREINKKFGTTLILTSHDMKDVEKICERAIVIMGGKIVSDGKLKDLKNEYVKNKVLRVVFKDKKAKIKEFDSEKENEFTHLIKVDNSKVASTLNKIMKDNNVVDIQILEPDITEIVEKIFENK